MPFSGKVEELLKVERHRDQGRGVKTTHRRQGETGGYEAKAIEAHGGLPP